MARNQERKRPYAAIVADGSSYTILACDPLPQEPAPYRTVLYRRHADSYARALAVAARIEGDE